MKRWIAAKPGRLRTLWGGAIGSLIISGLAAIAIYSLFRSSNATISLPMLLAQVNLQVLLTTAGIYALSMLLSIIGWGWMMGVVGNAWNWRLHARIYCITTFTRRLPGAFWYMLGRIVMYERTGVPRMITLVVGGLEIGVLIASGLLMTLLTWPFALINQHISPLWFGLGILTCIILLNPVVLRAVIRRAGQQSLTTIKYRQLLGWLLVYCCIWCGNGGILFVLANAVHPLDFSTFPAVLGIASATGVVAFLLTFVPFGLGIQELTITVLLSPFIGTPQAIIVALLARGVLTLNELLWAILGGLFGAGEFLRSNQAKKQIPHSTAEIPKEVADIRPGNRLK